MLMNFFFSLIIIYVISFVYSYKDKTNEMNQIVLFIVYGISVFLWIEFFIIVLAIGFNETNSSYIFNLWNALDFIALASITLSIWKPFLICFGVFRIVRLLKILSSHKFFNKLKLLITYIKKNIFPLISILCIMFCFLVLFGIIGLNLWVGNLHYRCQKPDPFVNGTFTFN